MKWVLLGMSGLVVLLLVLNWLVGWRHKETRMHRGLETWQGWDDGHGGGFGL